MSTKPIVIIGAGIGGLTAGVLLAARGENVIILERAAAPGGKMREVTRCWTANRRRPDGAHHALGVRRVIRCGRIAARTSMSACSRLPFWPAIAGGRASTLISLPNIERSVEAIGDFSGAAEARRFRAFSAEARHIYQTLKQPFMQSQRPGPLRLAAAGGLGGLAAMLRINPFETLWDALGRHFTDPRLRQLFGRYATYCGSSPFEAVATLMLIAHVEQEGVWAVDGGMHTIAVAMADLAKRHGAEIRYETEVSAIDVTSGRVSGVRTASGEAFSCSDVIVNADANAVASGLFGAERGAHRGENTGECAVAVGYHLGHRRPHLGLCAHAPQCVLLG